MIKRLGGHALRSGALAVAALIAFDCVGDDAVFVPVHEGTGGKGGSSATGGKGGGGGMGGAADDLGYVIQALLPGEEVPKFVDPLPVFDAREQGTDLQVDMVETTQKILPASFYDQLPDPYRKGTTIWAYAVGAAPATFPARTIEARRGVPTKIHYTNRIGETAPALLSRYLVTDQTIHWADPLGFSENHHCMHGGPPIPAECTDMYTGPVPTAVHLHGAEVESASDGHPDSWSTHGGKYKGAGYSSDTSTYANGQEATTLWFHDHTLGRVRTNVYAGLAGMYLLRDDRDTGKADNALKLPAGPYEMELAIADRQFDKNGQLFFPSGTPGNPNGLNGPPPNPDYHPYWSPEFFGDVITVNGKAWPYVSVEPRRYRFRVLDASNARFYRAALFAADAMGFPDMNAPGPLLHQIGSDGGLLDSPVTLGDPADPDGKRLFLAPAERADVIVDFQGQAGRSFVLINDAQWPFPSGSDVDPGTMGRILLFKVDKPLQGQDTTWDPSAPNPTPLRASPIVDVKPTMAEPADTVRQLVLDEIEGPGGPMEVLLNNSHWDGMREGTETMIPGSVDNGKGVSATEAPRVGSTEVWEIANLTEDAHPIHVHLVQFQMIDSRPLKAINMEGDTLYEADWAAAFPGGTFRGVSYPPGTRIPGYGPPADYTKPNAAGALGGNPAFLDKYFDSPADPPPATDVGWKDTLKVLPKRVTRIAVRWAPQSPKRGTTKAGTNPFSFDPTSGGPGYVWHCHIVDHEDNEMMRPLLLQK